MLPEISAPTVLTALREHREDREALLASLTAALQEDGRVRAAWLWGSFGRGEQDDLSDLDPWIVVSDAFVGEMGASLRRFARGTSNFIMGGEAPQNGPPGGGFFSSLHAGRHGLLHLDCYWQPLSAVSALPEQAVLFDRWAEAMPVLGPSPVGQERSVVRSEQEDRIADGIDFAWMMLSIAAKNLARHPDSDMSLMLYPRPGVEAAAQLLGLEGYFAPADWEAPESPLEKVERLRRLVQKTADLAQVASQKGLDLSHVTAFCLSRYLTLVEGILRR